MPQPRLSTKIPLKLDTPGWGLSDAQHAAAQVLARPELLKPLLRALFSDDSTLRHHASDTARRIAEKRPELLAPHTERLLGLFSESAPKEWRQLENACPPGIDRRPHRPVACTPATRRRPAHASLLRPINVVRCTAVEGLGLLAHREPSLRAEVEPLLEEALATGTLAMQCRARYAFALLH